MFQMTQHWNLVRNQKDVIYLIEEAAQEILLKNDKIYRLQQMDETVSREIRDIERVANNGIEIQMQLNRIGLKMEWREEMKDCKTYNFICDLNCHKVCQASFAAESQNSACQSCGCPIANHTFAKVTYVRNAWIS